MKTKTKKTKTTKKASIKQIFTSIILDESGSMESCRTQTIEGFNEYIKGLSGQTDDFRVTLTKFNTNGTVVVHDAVKVKEVPVMTEKEYIPNEFTPLYDAVGRTIKAIQAKVGTKQLVGTGVVVTVITDGAENASKEFTQKQVFDMIAECKKCGWTFAFLGANQDAWGGSQSLGILSNNVMYNQNNSVKAFQTLSHVHCSYSKGVARGMSTVCCDSLFSEQDKDELLGKTPSK